MGKSDVIMFSLTEHGRAYKLTENITLGEFISKGKDGSEPTPVDMVLVKKIQQMRDLLRAAVIINSGYRTIKHNATAGGATNSYHTKGMAADIYFIGISDEEAAACAEYVGFGGIGLYPGRIHVDTREGRYRYKKPGNVEIPVSGFPGFIAPTPDPTSPQDTEISIIIPCPCGATEKTVKGQYIGDIVYAPVRQLCEGLGKAVIWNAGQGIVTIK